MSLPEVRQVLETQLATINPAVDIAHENEDYTPIADRPYQRVTLLPAEPDNPEASRSFYREQGILQIDLFYPLQSGTADVMTRAELIRVAFKRGMSFAKNGIITVIERTPEIGPGLPDGDRYQVPVRVRWYANVAS